MSQAADLVELEAMRRLHNETLAELMAVEDETVPCAPEEAAELIGKALRLRARVKVLGDAIRASAARLGVGIAGEEPVTPSVH